MSAMTLGQVRDWHTKCAVVYEQSGESALADQHRSLAAAITAHLTQPAQSVDVEKVREVIARVAADNQKSALTLGVEGLRGQCIETAKELHKLTAALQEKGNG